VILGHVRAHDHDAVAVSKALLHCGRAAATEPGAQTGHRTRVSYTGLVFDGNDAKPTSEEFLDQVILLVVKRRTAQMCNA